ncbi:MAG: hypothetical protein K0R46_1906 [Herbinix sp.]|jgi:CarD family transcriptional regulator|nr:hypothetical protein [Herbinix sp.]
MFELNDYIIYGEYGVCQIADISTPPITGIDKKSKYYILHPMRTAGHTIYTPVDNTKVVMRKILTQEEALELINRIPFIDAIWIANDKLREDYYKKAMRSNDIVEWVKIIKTLYLRKEERKAEGKSVSATDEKYFKIAEMCLNDELALALGIPSDKMKDYMLNKVGDPMR